MRSSSNSFWNRQKDIGAPAVLGTPPALSSSSAKEKSNLITAAVKFAGISSSPKVYPTEDQKDMDCCGICSSRTQDSSGIEERDGENLDLITEVSLKRKTAESKSITIMEVSGPIANATLEGQRLSNLRQSRILNTKPINTTAPTCSTNMFRPPSDNI
jgi:hypothetical protein